MKKKLFSVVLSFVFVTGMACNGDTYFAGSQEDFDSIINDFTNNCCAGSSITITNIDTGQTGTLHLNEHGGNSSCSVIIV
ncbi:hypothetical protein ACFSKL_05675 [Belliella marina]|uniref:Uncharacterized protein n=1 Tax=Belliella marina TaxID=1644146 RepID=A0ABW4VKQ0_9BACT